MLNAEPVFSYEAARWTQFAWASEPWAKLRDRLRPKIISDQGRFFFHFYRDVHPQAAEASLQNENLQALWAAELTHVINNSGQALRRRCAVRLQTTPDDMEALLTLRWLNQRSQPH